MIWLVRSDFEKLIKNTILERLINDDDSILFDADRLAMAELQSYLRGRYNLQAIFSTTGTNRDALLIGLLVDILLYHLHARTPNVPKTREDRYNEAKRMLDDIKNGKIDLGLPVAIQTDDNSGLFYGSQPKRDN